MSGVPLSSRRPDVIWYVSFARPRPRIRAVPSEADLEGSCGVEDRTSIGAASLRSACVAAED